MRYLLITFRKNPDPMNESTRQKKVARLLQREIGEIFQNEIRNIIGKAFVTVTDVSITPDFSKARVYLSMLMTENSQELIEKINHRKSEIRGKLGHRVGHQMRIVPDVLYILDEIQEEARRLDALIDKLNIPPAPEKEND